MLFGENTHANANLCLQNTAAAEPGPRPLVLGPARRDGAAQPSQHLQGAAERRERPGIRLAAEAREPGEVGWTGRSAAEQRSDRAEGGGGESLEAGVGGIHGPGDRGGGPTGRGRRRVRRGDNDGGRSSRRGRRRRARRGAYRDGGGVPIVGQARVAQGYDRPGKVRQGRMCQARGDHLLPSQVSARKKGNEFSLFCAISPVNPPVQL